MFLKATFRFLIVPILLMQINAYGSCLNGKESPIQTISSFEEAISQIPSDALILFDIDDTLISSNDFLARGNYFPWWFRVRLLMACPSLCNSRTWEDAYSLMWSQAPRILLEPNIILKIKELQAKGHTILGLTSMETGAYGVIPNFPDWRFKMLEKMGITFSQDFSNMTFRQLSAYRYNYPQLYQGILCANQQPKGEVLAAFFDSFNLTPRSVVFFDDNIDALQSVGQVCKNRNIHSLLFHYTGAKQLPGSWNTERAIKQIKLLVEKRGWVSDEYFPSPS